MEVSYNVSYHHLGKWTFLGIFCRRMVPRCRQLCRGHNTVGLYWLILGWHVAHRLDCRNVAVHLADRIGEIRWVPQPNPKVILDLPFYVFSSSRLLRSRPLGFREKQFGLVDIWVCDKVFTSQISFFRDWTRSPFRIPSPSTTGPSAPNRFWAVGSNLLRGSCGYHWCWCGEADSCRVAKASGALVWAAGTPDGKTCLWYFILKRCADMQSRCRMCWFEICMSSEHGMGCMISFTGSERKLRRWRNTLKDSSPRSGVLLPQQWRQRILPQIWRGLRVKTFKTHIF